jgi:hypothetical protein
LALLHLGVLEGVQAAGVLEGGARGDGGGTVAGEREGVARDPGAGAVSVSSRRVSFLPQVAGVQKRDLPLAYTARSGVESQQDDAGITAELVLVRRSKSAHPREQDADVQASMHFLNVRLRYLL